MNKITIYSDIVKVNRVYLDVMRFEDLLVPHIQSIIEKISNDNNSEFDYN